MMVLSFISHATTAPAGDGLEKRAGSFKLVAYGIASSYIDIFFSDGRFIFLQTDFIH